MRPQETGRNIDRQRALRERLLEGYAHLIPHFQTVYTPAQEIMNPEQLARWQQSLSVVDRVREIDPRTATIVYALAVPMEQRVGSLRDWHEKSPLPPVREKQIIKRVDELDEQIRPLILDKLKDQFRDAGIKRVPEKPENRDQRIEDLESQREQLIGLLPEDIRREYASQEGMPLPYELLGFHETGNPKYNFRGWTITVENAWFTSARRRKAEIKRAVRKELEEEFPNAKITLRPTRTDIKILLKGPRRPNLGPSDEDDWVEAMAFAEQIAEMRVDNVLSDRIW